MSSVNLNKKDRFIRILLGAFLLGVFYENPYSYNLFAIFASYPILTAIMAWDPFYAIVKGFKALLASDIQNHVA
jgi:hypothetical protein